MKPQFSWKNGARAAGDAQVIGETLEEIRTSNNGELTPSAVVEVARAEDSPLHACFEWNDDAAAEKFREFQARWLISSVVVAIDVPDSAEPKIVRAFVVATEDGRGPYLSTVAVMEDSELRGKVIQRALRELHSWQQRYREYKELAAVFTAIETIEAPPVRKTA